MGNTLGASPTPQPSPVLDALKSIGSGALAIPRGIGQGVGDLTIGPGGYDRGAQEITARIIQTMLLGQDATAQVNKLKGYDAADTLYRTAPDTDLYRSVVEQALSSGADPQASLDRIYGSHAVPPFSALPMQPSAAATPGGIPHIQWGAPTIEEQQSHLKVQAAQRALDDAHSHGDMAGIIYGAKTGKNGVDVTMTDRPQPLFYDDAWKANNFEAHGFQGTPYNLNGQIAWLPTFDPAETARRTGYGSTVGKGQATLSPLPRPSRPALPAADTAASPNVPSISAPYMLKDGGAAVTFENGTKPVQVGDHLFTPDGDHELIPNPAYNPALDRSRDPNLPLGERESALKAAEKQTEADITVQEAARKKATEDTDNFKKLDAALAVVESKITPEALPGATTDDMMTAGKYALSQDAKSLMAAHGGQSYSPTQPLYALESTVDGLKLPISRALGDKNVRFGPEMLRVVARIFPNRHDTVELAKGKIQTLKAAARALSVGQPPAGADQDARDAWAQDVVASHVAAFEAGGAAPAAIPGAADIPLTGGFSVRLK